MHQAIPEHLPPNFILFRHLFTANNQTSGKAKSSQQKITSTPFSPEKVMQSSSQTGNRVGRHGPRRPGLLSAVGGEEKNSDL